MKQKKALGIIISLILVSAIFSGCFRGRPSDDPPIHLNPNMDSQPKYEAQEESEFFADGSAMRHPVAGTVARGKLHDDDVWFRGVDRNGAPVHKSPLQVNMQTLKRGRQRYDIFCSPCHSRLGDGKGIMLKRGYVPPTSFHTDRIRQLPDGEIFNVITNGIRNMPPYAGQIPVSDRWAIVNYVRALQRSQDATIEDIPVEMREKVK